MENLEMLKPNLSSPDDEDKPLIENFTHSFQKAVCIAHISIAPEIDIVKHTWDKAWDGIEKKISYKSIFGNKKMKQRLDIIPWNIKKKFLEIIEPHIILHPETQRQELINKCDSYELGSNRCQTVNDPDNDFIPTEPNEETVYKMVNDWMDKTFEQAEILRVIKYILLDPLIRQITAIMELSSSKKKGEHAKVLNRLLNMTKENYIFGYVYRTQFK